MKSPLVFIGFSSLFDTTCIGILTIISNMKMETRYSKIMMMMTKATMVAAAHSFGLGSSRRGRKDLGMESSLACVGFSSLLVTSCSGNVLQGHDVDEESEDSSISTVITNFFSILHPSIDQTRIDSHSSDLKHRKRKKNCTTFWVSLY